MVATRLPLAVGTSGLISIAMFSLLWALVSKPLDVGKPIEAIRIEFTRLQIPPPVARPPPIERVRPPVPVIPGTPEIVIDFPDEPGERTKPTLVPEFTGGVFQVETTIPSGIDHDATPTVRVLPSYPASAAAKNTEGWVKVQYAITATGRVADAVVIDANPAGVFEDAALAAIARWRYEPKIEHGVPVERVGLQTLISFRLEE